MDIVEFNPEVKASKILQEKVAEKSNMSVITNHAVKEFKGQGRLKSIIVEDRATGEQKEWDYDGVFIFIGLSPNSDLVRDMVEIDDFNFLVTEKTMMTSLPGLLAPCDARSDSTKQAASAVGEGASTAILIRKYLEESA